MAAVGALRSFGIQLALCRFLGQRGGRPRRAASNSRRCRCGTRCGLARPLWPGRVTMRHARIFPATRRSHPPRPDESSASPQGKPGPRHPACRDARQRTRKPNITRTERPQSAEPGNRVLQRSSLKPQERRPTILWPWVRNNFAFEVKLTMITNFPAPAVPIRGFTQT